MSPAGLSICLMCRASQSRANAVSPTGVRGIMMLTEATADYVGIEDRTNPESSIFGGAQYFSRMTERIADSVPEPDRTWMAMAAYNVGFYHLKDAMMITEWQGGDPNTWIDVKRALPLKAQRKWYSRVPYGYARGWEPVLYVDNVRRYYNIMKWLTADEELLDSETPDEDSEPLELVEADAPEESA